MNGKFIKKSKYYRGIVYEWNLPAGTTCPFAKECKIIVDRITGKFSINNGKYKCYAASAERFPAVRKHRWDNYEYISSGGIPEIPKKAKNIRIHCSGDFYSQRYFDMWIDIAKNNSNIKFWAFTKSIPFWIKRINDIPANLILTASYGGHFDDLIEKYNLKHTIVYKHIQDVPEGMPIDTNDDYARLPHISFALLDNNYNKK